MQTKNSDKKNESESVSESTIDHFVVLRNGVRVSDGEYSKKDDAKSEYDHWHRIVSRWPDGSKLEIVNINNKRTNK